MNQQLREKTLDKMLKMQKGDTSVFEESFSYACPKFISPIPPNYDSPPVNSHLVSCLSNMKIFIVPFGLSFKTSFKFFLHKIALKTTKNTTAPYATIIVIWAVENLVACVMKLYFGRGVDRVTNIENALAALTRIMEQFTPPPVKVRNMVKLRHADVSKN